LTLMLVLTGLPAVVVFMGPNLVSAINVVNIDRSINQ
jgi:hypothetical protein